MVFSLDAHGKFASTNRSADRTHSPVCSSGLAVVVLRRGGVTLDARPAGRWTTGATLRWVILWWWRTFYLAQRRSFREKLLESALLVMLSSCTNDLSDPMKDKISEDLMKFIGFMWTQHLHASSATDLAVWVARGDRRGYLELAALRQRQITYIFLEAWLGESGRSEIPGVVWMFFLDESSCANGSDTCGIVTLLGAQLWVSFPCQGSM
jgi:hypothetical protein